MISDFPTIAELAPLIAKGKLSPVELVESRLQRIAQWDGQLNSFLLVLNDEALDAAKVAEKEIQAGHYKGPLHGIPIGLKDIYETAGIPTTANSKILQDHIPKEDAEVVLRLKQAGAIIMGKQSTHEFALGGPSFDLPWPPARNPWDLSCVPGGSSSGSGAAVAAGLVLASAAGDTGGSIRNPAAFCGLAGLKPSYGLVSRRGVLPLAFSMDCAGPIAKTSEDCALMLQVMAGHDPRDPTSAKGNIPEYQQALNTDIKGLRVGLIRHFYTEDNQATPDVCQAVDKAAQTLQDLGCIVDEIHLSPLREWSACGTIIMTTEAYAIHEHNFRTRFRDYGEVFRDRLALAALFTSTDYIHAMQRRRELVAELNKAMLNLDVVMTATSATAARKIDAPSKFAIYDKPMLTIPFNVTGNPALSICCGFSDTGLPLGLQLVAKHFDEFTLFRLADAYEKASLWHKKHPCLL